MSLLKCADCSTQYALDLTGCPHCGSVAVEVEGAPAQRLPMFITVRCGCGRGPWTVRLESVHSGLVTLPTLACSSCGSRVPVTWPPEEEPMSPKITAHGGATNAREAADHSPDAPASQPLTGAEAGQGRPTSAEEAAVAAGPEDTVEASAEPDAKQSDGYDGMTLTELREAATSRALPAYGTKAQITERLREADAV